MNYGDSPAVEGEGSALLDGADGGGGVLDGVGRQVAGVGPQKSGAFGGFAVGGFAVPPAGFEHEPDAGVRRAGVALVNRQSQAEFCGIQDDAGFFLRFPDGGFEDVFAFLQVTAGSLGSPWLSINLAAWECCGRAWVLVSGLLRLHRRYDNAGAGGAGLVR